jgi:hypothetical protein
MISVDYLCSYTSHTHELRRVYARVREMRRKNDVLSKSRIDGVETAFYVAVDRA